MAAVPATSVPMRGAVPAAPAHLAFHLTGRRQAGLEALDGAGMRAALLAGFRDLTRLRYDFPVVLVRGSDTPIRCLSGVVDGVIHAMAPCDDVDRVTRHLLRLEREIRVLAAAGEGGALSALWDEAARRLPVDTDPLLADSVERGRAALRVDGEVLDCRRSMPGRLIGHVWRAEQRERVRGTGDRIRRLAQRLADILEADRSRSEAGRSAASLEAAVGSLHAQEFDFDELSRVLSSAAGAPTLSGRRRRRIEGLLEVLEAQRFFPVADEAVGAPKPARLHGFGFDGCAPALAAWRERQPLAVDLVRALAVADLEVEGEYREASHDALFADLEGDALGDGDLSHFPSYLIRLDAARLNGDETDRLMELLRAGLPVKILVQTDVLVDDAPVSGDSHLSFAAQAKQLASMALGLGDVYVLQASASHLFQFRDRIARAMAYPGPALLSVYSGAGGRAGGLPPFVDAAAAMEARLFPAYCYDPAAGANLAARFHVEDNTQAEHDWPVRSFAYEDEAHQRVVEDLAFTALDYLAADPRHARHFARVPREHWNAGMVPVADHLAGQAAAAQVPCVLLVDDDDRVHKAIVDDRLLRAAQRCREQWHQLQELGAIRNRRSERPAAAAPDAGEAATPPPTRAPDAAGAAVAPAAAAQQPADAPVAEAEPHSPDQAHIETPRCTTCNECTQINDRMFGYDGNRQARIVDLGAGTYRQLVEAAESCQVSIIHPGKPWNPAEPGLQELLARAEPFR
jgi:hypothetical protein